MTPLRKRSKNQSETSVLSVYCQCVVSVLSVCCQSIVRFLNCDQCEPRHNQCIVSVLSVCCQKEKFWNIWKLRNFSDIFWSQNFSIVKFLTIHWQQTGITLAIIFFWQYTDNKLVSDWFLLFPVCCQCIVSVLSETGLTMARKSWQQTGLTLTTDWSHTDNTLVSHWQHTGLTLTIHW